MHPFLQHEGPIPIVHRGAARDEEGAVVENTLAAFRRAYRLGFRYFETDVRATADGVLVASHDASLHRVAGERVRVADITWDELSQIPVGDAPLPRLSDLFDSFPDVSFNIDPKVDAALRPLVCSLQERQVLDWVCLASFSDHRLRSARAALGTRLCSAASPRELALAMAQLATGRQLALPGVDVLQIPRWMSGRVPGLRGGIDLLGAAQRVDIPVHVWTVNDGDDMQSLLARRVDGVMSDDTSLLLKVFGRHGWEPHP